MTEPLTFRSFLSKPDLIDFLDLLDFAAVKTSTGRQAVLNFLEENLCYATQPRDPDAFNFCHPKALAHYTWLLGFLQSQYLIDNASGNGLRTVELNRDFNKDLITLATVKNAFIAHYPQ